MTRPIRKLSIGTRGCQGDYAKRVLVRGHNEVSELAQDFNRMAQTVEEKSCHWRRRRTGRGVYR
ncbi:MAG: HAMP domain-containing protein [Bianqueaceae bacterium]